MHSIKYKAFISYSHKDEKWADWLHKALENYPIPKRLVGQTTDHGPIPKRLSPIFRDREELATATDLGKVVNAALAESACLIVICSPDAARSRWVNEEILAFKRLGNDRIFSFIVVVEPNAADHAERGLDECFPAALRFKLGPDGSLTDEPAEPIAADARPGKDGKANAKLKVISGMLGLGFDALKQREQQRRQRRLVAITAASLVGMVIATGLATAAWLARAEAERQRIFAEEKAETARQTTNFLIDLFQVSDPSEARGKEILAVDILDKGVERIQTELVDQPAIQATLMDTMGTVYTGLGLYAEAATLLERSLDIRREFLGSEHVEVASNLNHFGKVLAYSADYDAAEDTYREALVMNRGILGDNHPFVADSLVGLAYVLSEKGQYQEAQPLLREALAIRLDVYGREHTDVARSLSDLGLNLFDLGDYENSVPLLRESLALRRKLLGAEPHPDVAENVNNLGYVLFGRGDYEEAEELFGDALQMKRELFGDMHPDIAVGVNNLALVLSAQDDYSGAEEMYREVIALRQEALGDDHPDVAQAMYNLAFLLPGNPDQSAAVEMGRQSLSIYRNAFESDHPEIANVQVTLGWWLVESEEYEEAEAMLREGLAMRRRLFDSRHQAVAGGLVNLARLLVRMGRYDEALAAAGEARDISVAALSEDHWYTAVAGLFEGTSLAGLKRFEEAEARLLKSYSALDAAGGPAYAFRLEAVQQLSQLYAALGRTSESEKYIALLHDSEH